MQKQRERERERKSEKDEKWQKESIRTNGSHPLKNDQVCMESWIPPNEKNSVIEIRRKGKYRIEYNKLFMICDFQY